MYVKVQIMTLRYVARCYAIKYYYYEMLRYIVTQKKNVKLFWSATVPLTWNLTILESFLQVRIEQEARMKTRSIANKASHSLC